MSRWKTSGVAAWILVCLGGAILTYQSGNFPHDIVAPVPIGSRLSELDRYLRRAPDSEGEVREDPNAPNPYHGDYDVWSATPDERDRFTGEIDFYHHGSTSSDMNSLEYKDGRLIKKDWGFLPG